MLSKLSLKEKEKKKKNPQLKFYAPVEVHRCFWNHFA